MNKAAIVVLITFVVAITPSISDAEQLRLQFEANGRQGMHPWTWIGGWYVVLLMILAGLWGEVK